ncbi:hypothetical protein HDU98_009522 [Podochytrium sp. JEL0797]|nr:hypothetical protein HDU98_009522 [Podochytrium sp. JEL0797]
MQQQQQQPAQRQPTLPNVDGFLRSSSGASPGEEGSLAQRHQGHSQAATTPHAPNHPAHPRTLTRPDRFGANPNARNPFASLSLARAKKNKARSPDDAIVRTPWVYASWVLTCCVPTVFISGVLGKKTKEVQQAWREKLALNVIVFLMMAVVGFLTFGFQSVACKPANPNAIHLKYRDITPGSNQIALKGNLYTVPAGFPHASYLGANIDSVVKSAEGADVGMLFPPQKGSGACAGLDSTRYPLFPCIANMTQSGASVWPNQTMVASMNNATLAALPTLGCHIGINPSKYTYIKWQGTLVYDYADVATGVSAQGGSKKLMVYGGNVLDVSLFFLDNGSANALGPVVKNLVYKHVGKDASIAFANAGLRTEGQCLVDYLKIADVDSTTTTCFASTVVVWISLIIILLVVLAKFVIALYFNYFVGHTLGNSRAYQRAMDDLRRRKEEFAKAGGGVHNTTIARPVIVESDATIKPYTNPNLPMTSVTRRSAAHRRESKRDLTDPSRAWNTNFGFMDIDPPPLDAETTQILNDPTLMHCIAMVPCYSEGKESLKSSLDSIANSYYESTHKVLFVIADGIVQGSGNDQTTPDLLIDMIEVDERFRKDDPRLGGEPEMFSYVAIADGANRKNFAKVYAGWYKYDGEGVAGLSKKAMARGAPTPKRNGESAYAQTMALRREGRVPMILIVKCGNEEERDPAKPAAKPGNRGKRDSQVILMNFLCKVMFDDRMTELEFDIFFKLFTITGVNPEKYECVLMVDADTRIYPDSLSHMVACLLRDDRVMGLCGETKILNKWDSWVTMIQVFEYFVSHHMSKGFESVFGGVTCLPGCFSMYRIKSPKGPNGFWVPILANPDVVEEYSEHIVDTLHKKNLLLLGEDRFLSTMMLRQFPKRRMVFVPPAICKTVVPDTFKVLLSQRRRWINSTVHNLMELLCVNGLCGTFCISMQFIIFMDLVGTCVLPAAIAFTLTIIVLAIAGIGNTTLPLILLAIILGLPAVLIVMTANKPIYIFWMFVYLASLPVWNFVLPIYSFWHFDDFSWGETRKVSGEDTTHDHSAKEGEFDGKGINMKRWSEWVAVIRAEHERQIAQSSGTPASAAYGRPRAREGSISSGESSGVGSSIAGSGSGVWGVGGGVPSGMWVPPPGVGVGVPPQGYVQTYQGVGVQPSLGMYAGQGGQVHRASPSPLGYQQGGRQGEGEGRRE